MNIKESVYESTLKVEEMIPLETIVLEQHTEFSNFIKSLFIIDPNLRPSASEILKQKFLN